jgi:predicted dehydrogenase
MSGGGSSSRIDRRSFLGQTAKLAAGAAVGTTALSYSRILGANDRVSLGHIGVGNRGRGLTAIAGQLKAAHNVEMTAVCDLWSVNRQQAVDANHKIYGRRPRAFAQPEELLALKDVDAVLIATPEHSHSPLLKLVVEAGKDAYCEKPMGNVLEEVKAARDAVLERKRIVQIGTQHRSEPYPRAAHDLVGTGALGQVSKVEVVWNYHGPRWRGRPEVKQIRERDTDWGRWLMTRPQRPFDPQLYFEFRLYKEFSSGISDQWMSHGIDLVHWFMDDSFPVSVVAHGGVFAWHDGRENPDTFQALFEYPKGFLVSYATSFGNDAPSFTRYMGTAATLVNIGGEGSPRYQLVEEKGVHESDPAIYDKRRTTDVRLPGDKELPPTGIGDEDTHHMQDWFECLRSRKQPHATVRDGFAHSVACIMAAQSYWQGRRLYWDGKNERILDAPPST